jgi:hypothetical protein
MHVIHINILARRTLYHIYLVMSVLLHRVRLEERQELLRTLSSWLASSLGLDRCTGGVSRVVRRELRR